MSSFFDETEQILRWAERTQLPPNEVAEILRRRLKQCEEHLLWCACEAGAALEVYARLCQDVPRSATRMRRVLFNAQQTPHRDFFFLAAQVLNVLENTIVECAYAFELRGALYEMFGELHRFGHALRELRVRNPKFTDSPYPLNRRQVSNSDVWLRSKYPGQPWRHHE